METKFFGPLLIVIIGTSQVVGAAVYDGGEYKSSKLSDQMSSTLLGADLALSSSHNNSDRFASVPVSKPYYIVGEDGKCYWGTFSKVKEVTAMIIYYKSPVSNEHCIYQSTFNTRPFGYSISAKGGGQCIPSHVAVEGEKYDWILSQDGAELDLNNCFGALTSFGDNIDSRHKRAMAALEKVEPPAVTKIKSEPEVRGELEARETQGHSEGLEGPEASKRSPSSSVSYAVQVASYTSSEEAQKAVDDLKDKGFKAFVFTGTVANTTRYRVCVGHFPLAQKARELQTELTKSAGIKESFIQVLPGSMAQVGADRVN